MLLTLALLGCRTESEPSPDLPLNTVGVPAPEREGTTPDFDLGSGLATEDGSTTLFGMSFPLDEQRIAEVDRSGAVAWSYAIPAELQSELSQDGRVPVLGDVVRLDSGNTLFTLSPCGLFEVTPDGEIVWELRDERPSHDVDVLPNGNLLFAATWAAKGEAQIVEITPDGETVWEWTGVETFGEDPVFAGIADEGNAWMHVTSVERLDDDTTRATLRNFNRVIEIAPDGTVAARFALRSRENAKYADTDGTVEGERPHGTDWLDNGVILTATRRPDRVVQVLQGEAIWEYGSSDLGSIRDVDRLPNGNTLIAGHDRIVEVDHTGEIVWQWNVPEMPEDHLKPLMAVSRIAADGLSVDRD
ncbi:MAG: hypothetical protein GY913_03820 [Proteobacteria bacterium]|nr:hypothetical protein [Pseudomonadota bacterium]MCP4916030.1 hypothetical protein [Pseudomonadota bacterium]